MQRISFQDGLYWYHLPLEELQREAVIRRNHLHHPKKVTFVLDSNPNYTNVCAIQCSFCAFCRTPRSPDSYTKTIPDILEHMAFARQHGLSTVLLQGGCNPSLKIDYYLEMIRNVRTLYPDIHPHFFSATEIFHLARQHHLSVQDVLTLFWDAGLRTLPGGGAEILSDRVRSRLSPRKLSSQQWLTVHHTAHRIGFRSTATMMYGHIETPEEILLHLELLRHLQDQTGGFTAFIPWSYKPSAPSLPSRLSLENRKEEYFRILALSRIYLDNIPHIGASWINEGYSVGMEALHYGADDFGGILIEENVHRAAGCAYSVDHAKIVSMIQEAGFIPLQRDTFYTILRDYPLEEKSSTIRCTTCASE